MHTHSLLSVAFLALTASLLVACAADNVGTAGAAGGITGAAVGAGTGAFVNSDSAEGAAVGAAIGFPVGVMTGVAIHELGEDAEEEELDQAVEANAAAIAHNQQLIESLRLQVNAETRQVRPSKAHADHVYDGPTIGNPRR